LDKSNSTTSTEQFQTRKTRRVFTATSTVESLHRAAVVGALEAKLRVARYRARVLFTDRADLLTGILTRLQSTIEELAAMPTRENIDEDSEHVGVIARRAMAQMAEEQRAGAGL